MEDKKITIELTPAEALVLFEWLTRSDTENRLAIVCPAEQRVLWSIEGQLERVLKEPFATNYRELLENARKEIDGGK